MTEVLKHKVVLVDDHTLFRKGIAELVNNFDNYKVIWEAANGDEFFKNLQVFSEPEIVILDIAMPIMDGFETARILKKKYPKIKILILSMSDGDEAIIKMLRIGVHGYILKDADPLEFKTALDEMIEKGTYYSDFVSGTMVKILEFDSIKKTAPIELTNQEIEFLKLVSTELTYKEIAEKMAVSVRTIDGYRDNLFVKLNAKNRIGLVLYAIKKGYVKL